MSQAPKFKTGIDRVREAMTEPDEGAGVWLQQTHVDNAVTVGAVRVLEAHLYSGQTLNALEELALVVMAQTAGVNP